MDKVHAYVSWPHYAEHIAPIWLQLPEEKRGDFIALSKPLLHTLRHMGIPNVRLRKENRQKSDMYYDDNPVMVASYTDLRPMRFKECVLVEHGAGQSYVDENNGIHGGYAGGFGRRNVKLFLCPSKIVLRKNLDRYRQAVGSAVGSPRLDDLFCQRHCRDDGNPFTIAVSFHWECGVSPESGSAYPYFREDVKRFVEEARREGAQVIGHGHPKAWPHLKIWWQEIGVEPVASWAEVARRADCYVIDNSSTMFEAAALGIPVVVMESPVWRKDVNHGLRFWEYADVGPTVRPGDSIMQASWDSLSSFWERRRGEVSEAVYAIQPGLERASSRAAAHSVNSFLSG